MMHHDPSDKSRNAKSVFRIYRDLRIQFGFYGGNSPLFIDIAFPEMHLFFCQTIAIFQAILIGRETQSPNARLLS